MIQKKPEAGPVPAPVLSLEKVPQAAHRAALSLSGFYREVKAGRIGPLVKLGARSSAVPTASTDAYIAARIVEAMSKTGKKT